MYERGLQNGIVREKNLRSRKHGIQLLCRGELCTPKRNAFVSVVVCGSQMLCCLFGGQDFHWVYTCRLCHVVESMVSRDSRTAVILCSLCVAKEYRNQRVGPKLLNRAVAECLGQQVYLTVNKRGCYDPNNDIRHGDVAASQVVEVLSSAQFCVDEHKRDYDLYQLRCDVSVIPFFQYGIAGTQESSL